MQKKTCLTSVGQILLELEAFRSSYMNILLKVRKCILILLEGTESTAFVQVSLYGSVCSHKTEKIEKLKVTKKIY